MSEGRKSIMSVNSSYIECQSGIPLRLHGRIKYANEIAKIKKRTKYITVFRAILALIVVFLI